jgi:ATP phosphoribosyltransferase
MPEKTSQNEQTNLRLALPSRGKLADLTLSFLTECGLGITRTNPRQYITTMRGLPQATVLFQRAQDIVAKVADGNVDMGITGLDIFHEYSYKEFGYASYTDSDSDLILLQKDLGFGHCNLVIAVQEAWIDVESLGDIADIALDFREKEKQDLRIATKFPNLVRHFLYDHGITLFTLVAAQGTIEAAPVLGYADIIADLTTTGTTLRQNHLKQIENGVILKSQACLICNRASLQDKIASIRRTLKDLLERVDATIEGRRYYSITASVQGKSPNEIAGHLAKDSKGQLQDLAIIPAHTSDKTGVENKLEQKYKVTAVVHHSRILQAMTCLRAVQGSYITVRPIRYIFYEKSNSYEMLMTLLRKK